MGMVICLGTKVQAQKYYAVVSVEEKIDGSDKVARSILSNIFEITFCSNVNPDLKRGIWQVRDSGSLRSKIENQFKENYEAYHSRNGYFVNFNFFTSYSFFESYEAAASEQKKLLAESRKRNIPSVTVSVKIPCLKGV